MKDLNWAKNEVYYSSERPEMIDFLPKNAKKVLEVGCGNGNFGLRLKQMGCEIWGVEMEPEKAENASKHLSKVLQGNIMDLLDSLPDNYFDAIYFNDVIEHIYDPWKLLKDIKVKLEKENGVIISSIPNIRYFRFLFKFLFKQEWYYEDQGILDITHIRFFTYKTIIQLFESTGYNIVYQQGMFKTKSLPPRLLNVLFLGKFKDSFYPHFVTIAR